MSAFPSPMRMHLQAPDAVPLQSNQGNTMQSSNRIRLAAFTAAAFMNLALAQWLHQLAAEPQEAADLAARQALPVATAPAKPGA